METSRRAALLAIALAAPLAAGCSQQNEPQRSSRRPRRTKPKIQEATSTGTQTTQLVTQENQRRDGFVPTTRKEALEIAKTASAPSSLAGVLPDADIYKALSYSPSALDREFRWNHADTLIEAAHILLSRCLEARNEWQDRYLKFHTFLFELEQFEAIDRIHDLETKAGFYDIDYSTAQAELQAADSLVSNMGDAQFWTASVRNRVDIDFFEQLNAQRNVGWLSHISAYPSDKAPDQNAIYGDKDKTVIQHCADEAGAMARFNLSNELDRLRAEYAARSADVDSTSERMQGLRARATWEARNREFRKARSAALKKLFEKKRTVLSEKEGGLNFQAQLDAALLRCQRDFSDGLAHATAAARGLKLIFGYPEPLPRAVDQALKGRAGTSIIGSALDQGINWSRDASSWLSKFFQKDSLYAPTFSLRRLLTPRQWKSFVTSGEISFAIPEVLFSGQSHVRFRGISLHTLKPRGVYGAVLTPPKLSFYRMRDGSTSRVDQGDVPPIRIGAIRPYGFNRAPEVGGMTAAFNISPMGEWGLSMSELSSAGRDLEDIDDILIELVVAAIS